MDAAEDDKALADITEALLLDPKYARAILARGWLADAQGNVEEALERFDQVLALNPRDPLALGDRAGIWGERREYERATNDFDAALTILRSSSELWAARGHCWLMRCHGAPKTGHVRAR